MLATPPPQQTSANTIVAAARLIPIFSSQEMPGSINEIEELNAAMVTNRKNAAPKYSPFHIVENAIGNDSNSYPGPEPGSRLLAKTSGKIVMPATSAISVSRKATEATAPAIEVLAGI